MGRHNAPSGTRLAPCRCSLLLIGLLLGGAVGCTPTRAASDDPDTPRLVAEFEAAAQFLFDERIGFGDTLGGMDLELALLGLGQGPLQDGQVRVTSSPTWGHIRVVVLNLRPLLASGVVFVVRRGVVLSGQAIAGERVEAVAAAIRASGFLDGRDIRPNRGLDGEWILLEVRLDGRRRRALLWCPSDPSAVAVLRAVYTAAQLPFVCDPSFGTVLPEQGDPLP